ncbi:MAG: hypothetical protein AAGE84_19475 [Cyanobacteria bacterium P01_G01_bin.39]
MELIKYSVSKYVFHVPESMTDGVWKQAFEANNKTIPNQDDIYELEDKVYKDKLRNQQDENQVYLSASWTIEQVSELITGDVPFNIAREFAKEDLDNAGLGELGKYPSFVTFRD